MRNVAVLSLLSLSCGLGCAGASSDEAVDSSEQDIFWWHTHREIAGGSHAYRGSPAFSDDGTEIAYFETECERRYEVRQLPLQSPWLHRNCKYRVARQTAEGSRSLGATPWFAGRPEQLFYSKRGGYFVVRDLEGFAVVRAETGVLARLPPSAAGLREVVPSPDGRTLADASCSPGFTPPAGDAPPAPALPVPCTLALLDAATLSPRRPEVPVGLAREVRYFDDLDGGISPSMLRWTPAGKAVLTDHAQTAVALDPAGAVTSVTPPKTLGPATASSKVGPSGARLEIRRGKVRIVGPRAGDERFGAWTGN